MLSLKRKYTQLIEQTDLLLQWLTYSRHILRLANAVDYDELNVLKNIFISTMPYKTV